MRVFAIMNQKGGCGKTTTSISLAGVFAGRGRRTLLVDMDPQSHCAAGLAIPEGRIDLHIGDAMLAENPGSIDRKRLLWRVSRNLDLAPSSMKLAGLESARGGLAGQPEAPRALQRCLRAWADEYDLCLIDCSPSIGLLAFNALVAADEVVIPVETGFFSLQGATKQVNTIKSLGKRLGVAPRHLLLPTMHDPSSVLACDLLEELRRRFEGKVAPCVVRLDSALREAASFGQPVSEYSPDSNGARDYIAFADWLLEHSGGWGEATREMWRTTLAAPASNGPAHPGGESEADGAAETAARTPAPASTAQIVSRAADMAALARRLQPTHTPSSGPSPAEPSAGLGADWGMVSGAGALRVAAAAHRPAACGTEGIRPGPSAIIESKMAMPPPASVCLPRLKPPRPVDAAELDSTETDDPRTAPSEPAPLPRVVTPPAPFSPPAPRPRAPEAPAAGAERDAEPVNLGVQVTADGVRFVQPAHLGREIAIAGDFNNWSTIAHRLRLNEARGVLELTIPLPAGRWQYRIVVDGRWIPDPANPLKADNPFGDANSVVNVPAPTRLG